MNNWILCENCMPEDLNTYVLVTRQLSYYLQYVDKAAWSGDIWYIRKDDEFVAIDDVIAWQPLPEPYNPHPNAIKEIENEFFDIDLC